MRSILIGLVGLVLLPASAAAAPAVSGEFPIAGELGANNKIVAGPDGNMWVTVDGAKDVARVAPSGTIQEFDLEVNGALGIAAGPDGRLWITQASGVTSFAPGNPEGTKQKTEIAQILGASSIVAGPDGNLWVATNENLVRVPPANPAGFKAFPVAGFGPRDIDVAGSLLAIADFASQRVVMATTDDPPKTTSFPLASNSQGVAGAPGGQVAFSVPSNEFGLLTPPGSLLLTQSTGTDPFGVALGSDGAFWFAQFNSNNVTRLTADNQATTLAPGFPAASGPRQIAAGPGNTLWVTLQTSNKIGRISGLEPPAGPPGPPTIGEPRTKIDKGPKSPVLTTRKRATVKFRFSSPETAAGFQCRLIRLAGRKAKAPKAPGFKSCKSPKTYRLQPGRYRFEVRAVLPGMVDKTPAKRSFKVERRGST